MIIKTSLMTTAFRMLPINKERKTIKEMFDLHFAVLKLETMEAVRKTELASRFINRKVTEKQEAMKKVVNKHSDIIMPISIQFRKEK